MWNIIIYKFKDNNHISDIGAITLGKALANNTALKKIFLGNNLFCIYKIEIMIN